MRFFLKVGLAGLVFLSSVLAVIPFWDSEASTTYEYVSTASTLNVREKASGSAPVIATYKKGAKLDVIKTDTNGWTSIRHSGKTAYVMSKYVKKQAVQNTQNLFVVTASVLNVRKNSNTSAEVVAKLNEGDLVNVTKRYSNGWYSVRLDTNVVGFVSGDYIKQVVSGSVTAVYFSVLTGESPNSFLLSASVKGSEMPHYEFSVHKSGQSNWTTIRSYSANRQHTYVPSETGKYDLRVRAKDATSTKTYEKERLATLEVSDTSGVKSVDFTFVEPTGKGGAYSITATSTGSSTPHYKFSV
ncbi:MAG: SH3 domain-containing protein, partial [Bacilli bacterium]